MGHPKRLTHTRMSNTIQRVLVQESPEVPQCPYVNRDFNEPAVTYDPTKAATLQALPGPHPQGADLLGFLEQALCRADQPEPAPILDPEGNKYHAHWQQGVPLYHKTSVTVHAHPDLGVDARLGAYECVGPGWQLNVLLTHIPFGKETKDFLDTLSLAYRHLSLPAPTIIIGHLNAAPTDDDRAGAATATDIAVRDAMHQLGLTSLTSGLTGTPSHYPHQAGTHPSRIDTCYGDPTTVCVHEATYEDLPPTSTGHRPLYIDLIIPNLPPAAATLPDDILPPTLQFPAEDDHGAWHRYNRALHAILRRRDAPTLTIAMRRAAQACGMERDTNHTGAPPNLSLQQLVHDIWTTKEGLATLLRPSTPEARDEDAHLSAPLTTRRHQLQDRHAHRIAAAAQERETRRTSPRGTSAASLRTRDAVSSTRCVAPRGASPTTPTPSSRQSWTASRHNTGTPSPSSTPTPEAPSASMCPGSSTGNSGAPSNTTPSASQNCNAPETA